MSADLHHLAAAYALDALDPDERRAFERHYTTCEICSIEVADFRAVATALGGSTATPPPASLKSAVMAEIGQTRQLSPQVRPTPATSLRFSRRMVLAAAAALVLIGGVLVVTLPGTGDDDRVTELVASGDAVVTTLDPLTEAQAGRLQIVWSDERDQVAVVGSRLADPGVDKAYALWFLLDDGVAPAGLFRPSNGSVSAVLDVEDLDLNGWGITIEPAAGSEQPTTDVIFAGTI